MNVKGLGMTTPNCADTNAKSANQAFSLNLPRQALFSIADAANVRIACAQGSIWITLDNDLRDIVLDDCQVFTTTEHRRAVIYAMKPSRICPNMPAKSMWSERLASRDLNCAAAVA